jgi:hypothetical protein
MPLGRDWTGDVFKWTACISPLRTEYRLIKTAYPACTRILTAKRSLLRIPVDSGKAQYDQHPYAPSKPRAMRHDGT